MYKKTKQDFLDLNLENANEKFELIKDV